MCKDLLVWLFLPPSKQFMIKELLRILILGGYVDDQPRVDHNGSQYEHPRVFLNKSVISRNRESLLPMLICKL